MSDLVKRARVTCGGCAPQYTCPGHDVETRLSIADTLTISIDGEVAMSTDRDLFLAIVALDKDGEWS